MHELLQAVLASSDEIAIVRLLEDQACGERSDDGREPHAIGDPRQQKAESEPERDKKRLRFHAREHKRDPRRRPMRHPEDDVDDYSVDETELLKRSRCRTNTNQCCTHGATSSA